jgi:uncharacterized protein
MSVGMLNGFAFALLTSPSLFLAMKVHGLLKQARSAYQILIGGSAIVVGVLAILRGVAEMGLIAHWVLNPESQSQYHIVLF